MTNPSSIEHIVMRRVYTIRILRIVFGGATAACLLLLLALYGLGREVWVAKVFENGPQNFFGHSRYLLYAFDHTRLTVQALTLATLGSLIYLARTTGQSLTSFLAPERA